MPAFKNHKAQNPRNLKPQEKRTKTATSAPIFSDVVTGNRQPETGNEKEKMGPRGFEPLAYGCLRPLY